MTAWLARAAPSLFGRATPLRCLVVVAHPLATSLSHRFASSAGDVLASAGHRVSLIDLYAEDFDPRLSPAERSAYYATEHGRPAGDMVRHTDELTAAEALLLVFPTWWFGPPAMLKGWIDRVFAPGVAFDHGADFGPIVPRLTKLRNVVAITTLGTPWWVDRLVMHRPVQRMLKTAVVKACAPKARVDYLPFHAAENADQARVARFEARIRTVLAARLGR